MARLDSGVAARGFSTDLLVFTSRDPIPEPTEAGVRVLFLGLMAAVSRVPRIALYHRSRRPAGGRWPCFFYAESIRSHGYLREAAKRV